MVTILEHRDCGGVIFEKWGSRQATEQLVCSKCGKVWGVVSDLSDIDIIADQMGKPDGQSFLYEFEHIYWRANAPNSMVNWLFNERLRRAFKMIAPSNTKYVGLDVGCSRGYNTQHLSKRIKGIVIGVDVEKSGLYKAKVRANLRASKEKSDSSEAAIEYLCCEINHLPFKRGSIDLVLCVSVIEHLGDLEGAAKEIEVVLRRNGNLIVGYPIETRLFMTFLKLFIPNALPYRDPRLWGKGFESSPQTHKQSYTTIRTVLSKHFSTIKREKSFFTALPDQISWYECVKMKKMN